MTGTTQADAICKLCRASLETVEHLHTTCKVTRAAVSLIAGHCPNKDVSATFAGADFKTFLLHTPLHDKQPMYLLALSYAIWSARKAATSASMALAEHIKISFFAKLEPTRPRPKKRNRASERKEFDALRNSLDPDSLFYFTDGSSLGNPGPSGAGMTCIYQGNCLCHQSAALGLSTNNVAEIEGLLLAISHALQFLDGQPLRPRNVYIFCDNRYAISVADGKWQARAHRPLVAKLNLAFNTLSKQLPVHLLWVPGHADIHENEAADKLARRGATGISSLDPPTPEPSPTPTQAQNLQNKRLPPNNSQTTYPPTKKQCHTPSASKEPSNASSCKRPPTGDPCTQAEDPAEPRRSTRRKKYSKTQSILFPGLDFSMCHGPAPPSSSGCTLTDPLWTCKHGLTRSSGRRGLKPIDQFYYLALSDQCSDCKKEWHIQSSAAVTLVESPMELPDIPLEDFFV